MALSSGRNYQTVDHTVIRIRPLREMQMTILTAKDITPFFLQDTLLFRRIHKWVFEPQNQCRSHLHDHTALKFHGDEELIGLIGLKQYPKQTIQFRYRSIMFWNPEKIAESFANWLPNQPTVTDFPPNARLTYCTEYKRIGEEKISQIHLKPCIWERKCRKTNKITCKSILIELMRKTNKITCESILIELMARN